MIHLLLDNGHGDPPLTGGKCSPDKRILEYYWAREIVKRISQRAAAIPGVMVHIITPEIKDIALGTRTRRVNEICRQYGTSNCVLISVHINAAPGTGWSNASGFCPYVAPNASTKSKQFARMLWEYAERAGLRGNRVVPNEKYWVGNYAIIRDTNCPAVLTENLFMTNRDEVDYLISESGKQTIVDYHIAAFNDYIKNVLKK
ncbi:MAG: N-acetylmuramoyl-L-alanine amidase [Ruminococcus sp.]|nr:N-acetylmuramoyl-L-alanine amidase [Ruminococcus sp.]MCM1439034.1 N-acetylmuramoyl-L-alanine amidase [Roseburia sp.]